MKFATPAALVASAFLCLAASVAAQPCGAGPAMGSACDAKAGPCGPGAALPEAVSAMLSAEQRAKVAALQKGYSEKQAARCQKHAALREKLVPVDPSGEKAWAEYRKNLDAYLKLCTDCRTQALAHQDALAKLLTPAQRSAWLVALKPGAGCQPAAPSEGGCGRSPSGCPNR